MCTTQVCLLPAQVHSRFIVPLPCGLFFLRSRRRHTASPSLQTRVCLRPASGMSGLPTHKGRASEGSLKSHVYAVNHNMASDGVSIFRSTAINMFATMDLEEMTQRYAMQETASNAPLHKQLVALREELALDHSYHGSFDGRVTNRGCIKAIGMTCGT